MAATDLDARAALDVTQQRIREGLEEITDRANDAREVVTDRYHDLEDELAVEVPRAVRRARVGAWGAARSGLGVLLVLPKLIVRVLGALSTAADHAAVLGADVAERGADVADRGLELAESLPSSRRERRRARVRTAGWFTAGFGAGIVVGWVLARRQATVVTYDAPYAVDGPPWNDVDDTAKGVQDAEIADSAGPRAVSDPGAAR